MMNCGSCYMFHLLFFYGCLNKIETGKYKYPNKIHKMPIQTGFLNHKIMAPLFKFIFQCHNKHDDINYHTGKHMEAVKAGNGEKEICKICCRCRAISIWKRITPPPGTFM